MSNSNRKKFRQTKRLIALALKDGWTQARIAKACRTQQSVVSAWKNGEKQAFVDQVKGLLEQYGAKLRRISSQTYYDCIETPELNEEFLSALKIMGVTPRHANGVEVDESNIHQFKDCTINLEFVAELKAQAQRDNVQEMLACLEPRYRFFNIEGPVVFQHTVTGPQPEAKKGRVAIARLVVHDQGNGQFALVEQRRGRVGEREEDRLNSSDSAAIWWSRPVLSLSSHALINAVEEFAKGLGSEKRMFHGGSARTVTNHASVTLPYLIRKVLVEHGYPVDDVELNPASW